MLDSQETTFTKDSSIVLPERATTTGRPYTLENTGIERLPVITAVQINPVPKIFEIVVKIFIFLANFSLPIISSKK